MKNKEKVKEDKIREEERQNLVEYGRIHLANLIPYNDPNYEEKLQQMAEEYADNEMNSKF